MYGGGWKSFDEALENRIGRWCVIQDKRGC
jgi:hypothetical protein